MKHTHDSHDTTTPSGGTSARTSPERSRLRCILKIIGFVAGGLLLLLIVIAAGLTLWLSPANLTRLLNREASEYFNARIEAHNARFTFWSTFPRFCLMTDSVTIISRTLDDVPDSIRRRLPADSPFLASATSIRGGINIVRFLSGEYVIHDLEIEGLRLNLVAWNDSVNNYHILPPTAKLSEKVPFFTANRISLVKPRGLSWYSAATATRAHASIAKASLLREPGSRTLYTLEITGKLSARVERLTVLHSFPFGLSGHLGLRFHPFGVAMNDYAVNLGNIRGHMNMNIAVGNGVRLNRLDYTIEEFNLMRALSYMPGLYLPRLRTIKADIGVSATARLTAPYSFSSERLPSFNVDFAISEGELAYRLNRGPEYTLHHGGICGALVFNGRKPSRSYFRVDPFSLTSGSFDCKASATVTELMTDPLVKAKVSAGVSLARLCRQLPFLQAFPMSGQLKADSDVEFRLSAFKDRDLISGLGLLRITGNATLSDFSMRLPASGLSARARHTSLDFGTRKAGIADTILSSGWFDSRLDLQGITLAMGPHKLTTPSLQIKAGTAARGKIVSGDIHDLLPIEFAISSPALNYSDRADTISAMLKGFVTTGMLHAAGGHTPAADAIMRASGLTLSHQFTTLSMQQTEVGLHLAPPVAMTAPAVPAGYPSSAADRRILAFAPHSPEYLTVTLPPRLRDVLERSRSKISVKVASGRLNTPFYPADNRIGALDLTLDADSLALRRLQLSSGETSLALSAYAGGLRRFLTQPDSQPLHLDLDLALDTININQLAHTYYAGIERTRGKAAAEAARHGAPKSIGAADTMTMLIPRNISANVKASAAGTKYMNLRLYDLNTALDIANGRFAVKGFNISSDFGHAALDLTYDTSDLQNLSIDGDVRITEVDVVRFFQNFHTLLLMMPQMSNLSGMVSVEARLGMQLFPSMYLNIPSFRAGLSIQGRGLTVHQSPFIRRIARMMLIRTSDDIHIANMNVRGSVHDNLLELYPFNFEFDRYKLQMAGTNNFNGRLYYHIGVLKSPVPFPFGINIIGMFHHPELRFGGPTFKIRKGEDITADVMVSDRVNIISELKHYMHEFVVKAAGSDTIAPPSRHR